MAFNVHKYDKYIGQQFGYLTILYFFKKQRCDAVRAMCHVLCKCGKEYDVLWKMVKSGQSTSCGCRFVNGMKKKHYILYTKWQGMKRRCKGTNPNDKHSYIDKGISVCEEWANNPVAFCEWAISHGYKKGLELDRIDNDKGYSPENCRWVSHKENCRNRGNNHLITYNGKTKCLNEWAEWLGVEREVIKSFIKEGVTIGMLKRWIGALKKIGISQIKMRHISWIRRQTASKEA